MPQPIPFDLIVIRNMDWAKWLAQLYDVHIDYHPNGVPKAIGGVPVVGVAYRDTVKGKRVLGYIPYHIAVEAVSVTTMVLSGGGAPEAFSPTMKVVYA